MSCAVMEQHVHSYCMTISRAFMTLMSQHMIFQRVLPWRPIGTHATLEGLLPSVCAYVCCESVFCCKREGAQVAGEWLFSGVCVEVVLEVCGDIRGVVAVGAVVQLAGGGRAASASPDSSHHSPSTSSSSANPHLLRMSGLLRVTQVSWWHHKRFILQLPSYLFKSWKFTQEFAANLEDEYCILTFFSAML